MKDEMELKWRKGEIGRRKIEKERKKCKRKDDI